MKTSEQHPLWPITSVGETRRRRPFACAWCGEIHTAASGINVNALPRPGDASVCVRCGCVSMFMKRGKLRKPTAAEQKRLDADPLVQATIRSHAMYHRDKGGRDH